MRDARLIVRPATCDDAEVVTEVLAASYTRLWQGHYAASYLDLLRAAGQPGAAGNCLPQGAISWR